MKCQFCDQPGTDRGDEVCVCPSCWALLQKPETALPLIRGTVTMEMRGQVPKEQLDKMVNDFMGMLASWRRRD